MRRPAKAEGAMIRWLPRSRSPSLAGWEPRIVEATASANGVSQPMKVRDGMADCFDMANDWGKAQVYLGIALAQPWREGEGGLLSSESS